jgi:glycosyltransferase involved in cell wall biosynthesis
VNPPEVSVVIPCLNEERTIGTCVRKCLEAFRHDAISGEVVVIDNGSTDGTSNAAGVENARVVLHTIRGYGSALMCGITASRGRYVIMADGATFGSCWSPSRGTACGGPGCDNGAASPYRP